MNRRNAVTLTEVLIAIFVLSIGLMALLSLFPLGAAQMAQALKDQRCAEAAGIAGAQARMTWKDACVELPNTKGKDPPFTDPTGAPASVLRFPYAMVDPNLNNTFGGGVNGPYALPLSVVSKTKVVRPLPNMVPISSQGDRARAGYPVFVDPIGWDANYRAGAIPRTLWVGHPAAGTPLPQQTLAGPMTGLIPRRPAYVQNPDPTSPYRWVPLGLSDTNKTPAALRTSQRILSRFSLLDDITFDANGLPARPNGMIERQGRYSWAYLFRQQNVNQKNRGNVEMTVVVYSGRSIDVPSPEDQYLAVPRDARSLTIAYSGNKPALRRGSWILDATIFNNRGEPDPQGYFYRVTNVDDTVPGQLTVDLQTALNGLATQTGIASNRVIVVMENVVEVFPKGIITAISPPGDYRTDDLGAVANP